MKSIENESKEVKIGILVRTYREALDEALTAAKELSKLGVSHPWVNRTDLTTERSGMRSPSDDSRLIAGSRMRLEVR